MSIPALLLPKLPPFRLLLYGPRRILASGQMGCPVWRHGACLLRLLLFGRVMAAPGLRTVSPYSMLNFSGFYLPGVLT